VLSTIGGMELVHKNAGQTRALSNGISHSRPVTQATASQCCTSTRFWILKPRFGQIPPAWCWHDSYSIDHRSRKLYEDKEIKIVASETRSQRCKSSRPIVLTFISYSLICYSSVTVPPMIHTTAEVLLLHFSQIKPHWNTKIPHFLHHPFRICLC
jgi:hypothetical protein